MSDPVKASDFTKTSKLLEYVLVNTRGQQSVIVLAEPNDSKGLISRLAMMLSRARTQMDRQLVSYEVFSLSRETFPWTEMGTGKRYTAIKFSRKQTLRNQAEMLAQNIVKELVA